MNGNSHKFESGDHVHSERFGTGRVQLDQGPTVIVRFEQGIEECEKTSLRRILTPVQALDLGEWHRPLEVIARIQAEAIQSANDTWGVFSRSRIALLPHQLWVCKRVLETWPTRWLVADDVGLGKTIEAGLILWPLISKGDVKRFLIVCPASLREQWQYRLRTMFDIRVAQYVPEADTKKSDFWGTHDQVVASLQTVRKDHKGRHNRLFESAPWDLVIIDEAHHLNADEKGGPTLGYQFAERLVEDNLVTSMVFFTGTPHRGKNFGFLSLLRLLKPEIFDPGKGLHSQLSHFPGVMIRNNKRNVTDLRGKRLFQPHIVSSETFSYSEPEAQFYAMLTEFIETGQAYASSLGPTDGRTVKLVLTTMQKLASSSVAAIRRALRGRLQRIVDTREKLETSEILLKRAKRRSVEYENAEAMGDTDRVAELEEEIDQLLGELRLMEDEEPRIRELLSVAEEVKEETKINRIIPIVEKRFARRKVLFFTEYKATQSLLMSALLQHFGDGCVTFINGDNQADEVIDRSGVPKSIRELRDEAADKFNEGGVRFLVSTEAAGEGVDLQEQCHTLIHVDLPWNPMRLHQRVGRLDRYGQTRQVEVVSLRNPDTVEARIWDKLEEKIANVMTALNRVMEEPEDLYELILGMTPPSFFREVFSEAENIPPESLSTWFDEKTAHFGNKDAINTVRDLVGNCSKFDYEQVSPQLPKVDLPALRPFLISMLSLNKRRIREDGNGISFKTPESWLDQPGVRSSYENMIFERKVKSKDAAKRILGVGHKVIDQALRQAQSYRSCVTTLPKEVLKKPIITFEIIDRVTTEGGTVQKGVVGVEIGSLNGDSDRLLRDWELILKLNELSEKPRVRKLDAGLPLAEKKIIKDHIENAHKLVEDSIEHLNLPFKFPVVDLSSVIWPR